MIDQPTQLLSDLDRQDPIDVAAGGAAVVGALPRELVFTERAAAQLREYLVACGLDHYRIFFGTDVAYDIDEQLDALGESGAAWERLESLVAGGEAVHALELSEPIDPEAEPRHGIDDNAAATAATLRASGVLRLRRAEIVFARWHVQGLCLWLCAAPTTEHYQRLRARILRRRRARGSAVWQVVRGYVGSDDPRTPRDPAAAEDVLLPPALRRRIDTDVVGFFSDDVARLYRALKVPYRRGVLLYGPPGNGKTSLVRYIGAKLLDVPAMLLRASANFDTDDLVEVLRRWREQAPAILVIEDLDWLLRQVNVSTLLNLLDGVDSTAGGGLLLIATTNNPQELDPAINNRPGRFDVVIEIDRPDRAMRLELLRRKLPEIDTATRDAVADATDGLSFAHVVEILRLSGFAAIAEGRTTRTESDLLDACETVKGCNEEARRGFPPKLDVPFGLQHRRR